MNSEILDNNLTGQAMSIVVVGHVDHGKSTLVGRLLANTGVLPQGRLEQVRDACERAGRPFEYAYLIDALKDERSQGITIDTARVFFQSPRRRYLINDAPGHIEFLKNMVTGAARAEAALLVIDAEEGIRENSRRHGYLLWMLGIKKIVVLVNKMDLVGYSQQTFDQICTDYTAFLDGIGVKPRSFIPVSGIMGDNISEPSTNMPWFHGGTVLSALDEFETEPSLLDQPFRMPVQDIYKFSIYGDSRRIIAGSVISGSIRTGDEIIFYPSGKRSLVSSVESFNRPQQVEAVTGEAAGLCLEEQIYIQRGEIGVRANQLSPKVSTRLRASLFWLGKNPLKEGKEYLLKVATTRVKAHVEKIHRVIDAGELDAPAAGSAFTTSATAAAPQEVRRNWVAEITFKLSRAIAFDLAAELQDTGRFVIIDDYEICGGGIILEDLPDPEKWARDITLVRNVKWIQSLIGPEKRAEKYNQRASLILITGEKGAGRKTIANQLEATLFNTGKMVYYLGLGSVIYGVDGDIQDQDREVHHQEHIRRFAEVAHILLDVGLILITTAVRLTQADLDLIQTVIDGRNLQVIWVGDDVTTDLTYDLRVTGGSQADHSVTLIKRKLQDEGIIFRP
ncbi:MAG: adenylyl-sulfate kinase [Anaerolineaceae bacterium]|nr:adenylyl-sulfate kinase [Anaerolineaceae bacterium]